MKKLLILLVSLLMLTGLASCSGGNSGTHDETGAGGLEFDTLADAYAVNTDEKLDSLSTTKYVYVFKNNGALIRVTADINEELYEEVNSLSISDSDYIQKKEDILAQVKITSVEDLSTMLLSDQSAKALAGEKGKKLTDEGFKVFSYYGSDNGAQVIMEKNVAQYLVTFDDPDGKVNEEVNDNKIKDLEVKNVQYYGLSSSSTQE